MVILSKTNLTVSLRCALVSLLLLLLLNTWLEAGLRLQLHPLQPFLWQRYLGLPRPEAEGHPGQQYNSSTARVPEGLRPERRDLGGWRVGAVGGLQTE